MLKIDPKSILAKDMHQFVLGAVSPRPIALASTIDENGNHNLAPYSFFNAFSSNPPIVVFSSNRRLSDNTTKDTLYNIKKTGEVVINAVNYDIVRQMTIASVEFPSEVSEFKKSGLTPIPSELVKPPRVKESPVHMECKVKEIIPLGDQGGAGHLIICEIVRMHIAKSVMDDNNRIDPHKIDLMGRMGRAYYVRASGEAIHTIVQPILPPSIGFEALPESAKNSSILTGNNLGRLAGMTAPPTNEVIEKVKKEAEIIEILSTEDAIVNLHRLAQIEMEKENLERAAALVWING